jgi:hypothetical protein
MSEKWKKSGCVMVWAALAPNSTARLREADHLDRYSDLLRVFTWREHALGFAA